MRGRRGPGIMMAVTLWSMGLIASCGHALPNAPLAPARGAWQSVNESTQCEALLPAFCVGLYGFSIDHQGQYTAGPSPAGHTVTGALTADEFTVLNRAAQAVAGSALTQPLACDQTGPVPGASDQIMLTGIEGQASVIYRSQGGRRSTCYAGGKHQAQRLHDALHTLMLKYYPSPFP
jgi:hypothetical protein